MDSLMTAFKKWNVFSGRATRKEYWIFTLLVAILGGVLEMIFIKGNSTIMMILWGIVGLYFAIAHIAVQIRRLHDIGKSGWFILLNLIPFVGSLVIFIFNVMDSNPGTNQYGPNPKGIN